MKIECLNGDNLDLFRRRLDRVTPRSGRRWGRMEPVQMIGHLRRSVEISLGEVPQRDISIPGLRRVLWWLAFDVLPWPKGKLKSPAHWFPAELGSFEEERARLDDALRRFVEAARREPGRREVSSLFGPLPLASWSVVHGKHFDHHLRQFGA